MRGTVRQKSQWEGRSGGGEVQDGFVALGDQEVAQVVESTKGQPGSLGAWVLVLRARGSPGGDSQGLTRFSELASPRVGRLQRET